MSLSNDSSEITIRNWYDFLDFPHLNASWHLVQDGAGNNTSSTPLNISVAAGETTTVPVPVNRKHPEVLPRIGLLTHVDQDFDDVA